MSWGGVYVIMWVREVLRVVSPWVCKRLRSEKEQNVAKEVRKGLKVSRSDWFTMGGREARYQLHDCHEAYQTWRTSWFGHNLTWAKIKGWWRVTKALQWFSHNMVMKKTFFCKIIVDANGIQVKRNFSTGVLFCTHKAQHQVAKIANFEKLGWFILWDTLNWLY